MNNYFESKITYLTTNALHQCAEKARLHDVNVKNYFERYFKGSRWLNLMSLLSLSLSLPSLWSALSSFLSTLLTDRLHYSPNMILGHFHFSKVLETGLDPVETWRLPSPLPLEVGVFFFSPKTTIWPTDCKLWVTFIGYLSYSVFQCNSKQALLWAFLAPLNATRSVVESSLLMHATLAKKYSSVNSYWLLRSYIMSTEAVRTEEVTLIQSVLHHIIHCSRSIYCFTFRYIRTFATSSTNHAHNNWFNTILITNHANRMQLDFKHQSFKQKATRIVEAYFLQRCWKAWIRYS